MSPEVSVIIPTFRRLAQLREALEALRVQQAPGLPFEVLVVDDGSGDGSDEAIQALAAGWKELRVFTQANAGPGVARNRGASEARAPVLAFLDDDAVPAPDWISASVAALRQHPDWDGFEGAVLPQVEQDPALFVHQVANTKGGQWLTCNLWVRRQAFLDLGGFDPRYRWIREHTDWAFRALDRGLSLPFYAASVVRHPALRIGWRRYFRDAQDGQYEALLERSHPQRYREHLKWIDGRALPVYTWAHYGAPFAALIHPALGWAALATGTAATLYAWCRRRRLSASGVASLVPLALVIPYVRLAWVAWGYWRYPASPEGLRPRRGFAAGPVLAVVLTLSLYLLSRVPFLTQPLVGEEGIFAHLMAEAPRGPDYVLMARMDGKNSYAPPLHPAPLYAVYGAWGKVLRALAPLSGSSGPVPSTDREARLAQSFFQGLLWAVLAWRFGAGPSRSLLLGLLLLGLSSPLGMSASIYLQADTSTGLLSAAFLSLALVEAETAAVPVLALFALAALGKQEWSLAALLGLAFSQGLAFMQALPGRWTARRWAWLGLGLGLGHLCNWAFDPLNYRGGWGVFHHVAGQQGAAWLTTWAGLWPARSPFVLSLLAVLLPSAALAFSAPRERRARELDASALAWAFFLLFFLSAWNDSPRYFAPAWGAGLAGLAAQCAARRPRWRALGLAWAGLALLISWQCLLLAGFWIRQASLTDFPFSPVPAMIQLQDAQVAVAKPGCVPRLQSAYAWNRPLDFMGSGIDMAQAAALAQAHGKSLCAKPAAP